MSSSAKHTVSMGRYSTSVRTVGWATLGWSVALIYFVLLGGTPLGDVIPELRLINGVIGAVAIAAWIGQLPRDNDLFDRACLAALLLFLAASISSSFPRQSFDAAVAATAYTAVFYLARRQLISPENRGLLLAALRLLLLGLLIGVVALWGYKWIQWLRLHDWGSAPPLDMPLPAGIWGHKHDLVLLLVLLAPAVLGITGRKGKALVWPALACVALLVVLDGSRNLWLAIVVSGLTCLVALAAKDRRISPRTVGAGALGLGVIVGGVAVFSDFGGQLMRRLTNFQTLDARLEQWIRIVDLWHQKPLQGWGPGSYPFLMRLTDYFRNNSYVSRHPDGAVLQSLGETGLLGVAAVVVLLAGIVLALKAQPGPVRLTPLFAILVFVFTGLAANPADYGFLIVVMLLWAAVMLPPPVPVRSATVRLAQPTAAAALAVFLVAVVFTGATFAYSRGAQDVASGDYDAATTLFDWAARADPGMALYVRERGASRLLAGDAAGALVDFRLASRMNPADDVALRSWAVAEAMSGHMPAAVNLALTATGRMWTDVTNQQVVAWTAKQAGDSAVAVDAMAATIEAAPWIAASATWQSLLPDGDRFDSVLARAAADLRAGTVPTIGNLNGAWIAAMARDGDLLEQQVIAQPRLRLTAEALADVLNCDASSALTKIRDAEVVEGSETQYWTVRLIIEWLTGVHDARSIEIGALLNPAISVEALGEPASPDVFTGGLRDQWGYRRWTVAHPTADYLTSSAQGVAAVLKGTWRLVDQDRCRAG